MLLYLDTVRFILVSTHRYCTVIIYSCTINTVLHKITATVYYSIQSTVIAFQLTLQIGVAIVFSEIFATFASSPHNFDILENFQNFGNCPFKRKDSYKTVTVIKSGKILALFSVRRNFLLNQDYIYRKELRFL